LSYTKSNTIPYNTSSIAALNYNSEYGIIIACSSTGFIYWSSDLTNWKFINSINSINNVAYSPSLNILNFTSTSSQNLSSSNLTNISKGNLNVNGNIILNGNIRNSINVISGNISIGININTTPNFMYIDRSGLNNVQRLFFYDLENEGINFSFTILNFNSSNNSEIILYNYSNQTIYFNNYSSFSEISNDGFVSLVGANVNDLKLNYVCKFISYNNIRRWVINRMTPN
jgi:hypothetical protein